MRVKDYYAILGVSREASIEEIRRAYRRLAREHHPDLHPDDPAASARQRELNEAYAVLSDPARRASYERARAAASRRYPPAWQAAPPAPFWSADARFASAYVAADLLLRLEAELLELELRALRRRLHHLLDWW